MNKLPLVLALVLGTLTAGPSTAQTDDLLVSSQTQINYAPLDQLLVEEQWRQANDLTFNLMLQAAGRNSQGWMDLASWQNLPCEDLQIINQLWQKHSNNHFGFTPQLEVFLENGNIPGRLGDEENFEAFADQIGWRVDGEWIVFKGNLNFSLDSPVGHLPNPRQQYEVTRGRLDYTNFAEKSLECNLIQLSNPPSPEIRDPGTEI